jgi:hypothetical protein
MAGRRFESVREKDTNSEGGWRVPCVMRWPVRAGDQRAEFVAGFHPDLRGCDRYTY